MIHAAAKLSPNLKIWSERGDSNPGPLPPQSSAAIKSNTYRCLAHGLGRFRFYSVLIMLRLPQIGAI